MDEKERHLGGQAPRERNPRKGKTQRGTTHNKIVVRN